MNLWNIKHTDLKLIKENSIEIINSYYLCFLILIFFLWLNAFFLEKVVSNFELLHFETASIVMGVLVASNASILVYYSVIPKIDVDQLKKSLVAIKNLEKCNLEKTKGCFDEYFRIYKKCIDNQNILSKIKNINYFCMVMTFASVLVFMYSAKVYLMLADIVTILVLTCMILIGKTTDSIFIVDMSKYPLPEDLLNIKKKMATLSSIDIRLHDDLNLHLLSKGIKLIQINVEYDDDLYNAPARKSILKHYKLMAAVEFDFQRAKLLFNDNGRNIFQTELLKENYNYYSINPSIDILSEYNLKNEYDLEIRFINTINERISITFHRQDNDIYTPFAICIGSTPLSRPWENNKFIFLKKTNSIK